MSPHATLHANLSPCFCSKCRKHKCDLKTNGLRRGHIRIIDCDVYKAHLDGKEKICDFIVAYCGNTANVAVVELKGGSIKAEDAIRQIQNGARLAEALFQGPFQFFPILLHGKGGNSMAYRVFDRPIMFRGKRVRVLLGKCGDHWNEIAEKYGYPHL